MKREMKYKFLLLILMVFFMGCKTESEKENLIIEEEIKPINYYGKITFYFNMWKYSSYKNDYCNGTSTFEITDLNEKVFYTLDVNPYDLLIEPLYDINRSIPIILPKGTYVCHYNYGKYKNQLSDRGITFAIKDTMKVEVNDFKYEIKPLSAFYEIIIEPFIQYRSADFTFENIRGIDGYWSVPYNSFRFSGYDPFAKSQIDVPVITSIKVGKSIIENLTFTDNPKIYLRYNENTNSLTQVE